MTVVDREVITRNSAKCLSCGDEIVSAHRHDFVTCVCGNLFVDGGNDYRRRGFKTGDWEDTSVYTTEPIDLSWTNE